MNAADPILVPVSAGELIDKITILQIKAERFDDPEQLAHVRRELSMLEAVRERSLVWSAELRERARQLKLANEELWQIEDAIRRCECRQEFGAEFVALARSVYRTNDRRSTIKREINALAGSSLVEEKRYPAYR